MANDRLSWLRELRERRYSAGVAAPSIPVSIAEKPREIKAKPITAGAYKHRNDPKRRKEYMKLYMRRKRALNKATEKPAG